jgi:hypothetical protein
MTSIDFVAYVVYCVPLQWQGGGKLLPRSCRFPDKSNGYAEAIKLFLNNGLCSFFRSCQIVDADCSGADIVEQAAVGCHYLLQDAGPCLWQRKVQRSYCVLVRVALRGIKLLDLEPP